MAHYKKNNRLETAHRNHIVECVVEFFLNSAKKMIKTDFEKITDEIIKMFPGELKVRILSRQKLNCLIVSFLFDFRKPILKPALQTKLQKKESITTENYGHDIQIVQKRIIQKLFHLKFQLM